MAERSGQTAKIRTVPEGMTYYVKRVTGAPDWESIPVLSISNVLWREDTGIRAYGRICCNDESLFVHLRAAEKDIRAECTKPLSPVWEDSCLEFFFSAEGSAGYFNFEINPNGCHCIQYGSSRTDRVNLIRNDAAGYFDIRTARTPDGWEVFYRIPLRFLQIFWPEYRFEGVIRGNLYKCGDKTVHPHYLSWAPIDLKAPDFHCPAFFGSFFFE